MRRGRIHWLSGTALTALLATTVFGSPALAAWVGPRPRVAAPAAPRAESENYVVALAAEDEVKAARESVLSLTIEAKPGFHINPQFPIRFKANDPPDNVSFTKPVMKREDGEFNERTGSFKVRFTAQKPGKYNLGGTVALSFCSEKNCVMEKVPLDIDVTVK